MTSVRPIKKKVKKEESLQRLNDKLVLAKSKNDRRQILILEKCIKRVANLDD
jgi:hypothetical protein